jgi:peptidoglycan hydrolase-like protein with peptidoglycan-binding domain
MSSHPDPTAGPGETENERWPAGNVTTATTSSRAVGVASPNGAKGSVVEPTPPEGKAPKRGRRRRWLIGGVSVVALAATAAVVRYAGDEPPAKGNVVTTATAKVTRTDLAETTEVSGTLGYGDAVALPNRKQGVVTSLPGKGSTVSRGKVLYRVNGAPVVLLYGPLPAYRALAPGIEGADVAQFERNLAALGYSGFTVDDEYSAKTATAVKEWQEDLGVAETGTVDPADISYAAGAVRIADHKVLVGGEAAGPVVSVTGTARIVTVDLDVDDQQLVRKGAAVTVSVPGGGQATGTITAVGNVAETQESEEGTPGDGESTIPVTITLKDVKNAGGLDQAPVQVQLVSDTRKGVLTVPVAALLALQEGGYGVAVTDGGKRTVVAVETGMFANSQVEVTGAGLREGSLVEVPAP